MSTAHEPDYDSLLAEDMGRFYDDPLGFVMYAYPWDTDRSLQVVKLESPWSLIYDSEYGPDRWACEFLDNLGKQVRENAFDGISAVDPILESISSGHGIGKSAMTGWLTDWIMSTRPFSQGTVTATTSTQLETKTWAQITKWTKMCITSHWFEVTTGRGSMKMYHKLFPEKWFCSAQTCREENSEAFAGQHAVDSTSFYIFDEAAGVPDKIYEVAEGGLTDGEPMWFLFGNPTKNVGRFKDSFGRLSHRWNATTVDSRDVQITNKKQIAKWEEDHGEDSDFFRVRVRGVFPRAASMQYFSSEIVREGQVREAVSIPQDPLVMSLDVSRGGDDNTVIRFRRGFDARTIPTVRIPGSETRDSMQVAARVAKLYDEHKPDAFFMDSTGLGGPIGDRLIQLGYPVILINFASASPDKDCANMRAYMYKKLDEALKLGLAIEDDSYLTMQFEAQEFTHDRYDRLLMVPKEMVKKTLGISPDDVDALALLFAQPVNKTTLARAQQRERARGADKNIRRHYNPYSRR